MKYKRIVIKVGTNLVNRKDNSLNTEFLEGIVRQISALHKKGHEIVFVTSGAVASGRRDIALKKETRNIPYRQALSAVGQGILIHIYRELFGKKGIKIAQGLLTNHDFTNRKSYITTKNTLEILLDLKVIPIINENDFTVYAELKFGDNDMLSAKTAAMIDADLLLLLTDVPCVYDKDPKKYEDAQCVKFIEKIDSKLKKIAGKSASSRSMGGMESKIKAAEYAVQSGIPVIIAGGTIKNVLIEIVEKDKNPGTFIKTNSRKSESRKNWLKSQVKKNAKIIIDDGAKKAILKEGKSLLPVGVKEVRGRFERGDVIEILDLEENILGVGQTNYKTSSIQKIKGKNSKEISNILKAPMEDTLIHRDNMIVF